MRVHPALFTTSSLDIAEEEQRLCTLHEATLTLLKRVCSQRRAQPRLDLLKQRVPVKKQHAPLFESDYVLGKKYGREADEYDRKAVKRQLKSETRSAVRELRKDSTFLQSLQRERQAQNDERLLESQNRAKTFLQDQQSLTKELDINKHKDKMRAKSQER